MAENQNPNPEQANATPPAEGAAAAPAEGAATPAEGAPAEGATPAPAEGGGKKKLFIIIGAAVGALLLIGGGVLFLFKDKIFGNKNATKPKVAAPVDATLPFYYELPDVLVNLNKSKGHLLKIKLFLEVGSDKDLQTLKQIQPRIIDQLQVYLRTLSVSDVEGSQGALKLREEVLLRVNNISAPVRIKDVLFKDLFVQ